MACAACASTDVEPAPKGNLKLTDANNYQSQSALSIPVVETAPGASLNVCFGNVVKDIQCHDIVPTTDIDNVGLLRFLNATPEAVQQKLVQSQLASTDYDIYRYVNTTDGQDCIQTSSMEIFDVPIDLATDYKESPADTYMLVFTRGTAPGLGTLTMVFVKPVTGSTNTDVNVDTGCSADETTGLLNFTANLAGATPLVIPPGDMVVDWSDVNRDGGGGDIRAAIIDRAMVAFYQGKTVADLEAQIFDLELIYTDLYEMPVTGNTADLALAVERNTQAPFPGFTKTDGVWILALMCSECQNPAPIVLTVITPG